MSVTEVEPVTVLADLRREMAKTGCLCLWSRCPVHGEGTGILARAHNAITALSAPEVEPDEAVTGVTCYCPLNEVKACRYYFDCKRTNARVHPFNGNLSPTECATCELPPADPIHGG